jgi:1-acyl-sn-glycerol-3-phosphate acyltransferase
MAIQNKPFQYPRRRVIRWLLRAGITFAFWVLMDLKIEGKENLPQKGPYIAIGNHFHFLDPLALILAIPEPMEFVGGYTTPNAPAWTEFFRKAWGVLMIRRGASSRDGLNAAQSTLEQKGILAIFPEGGSWATVLRPPRQGTALLAMRTTAPILPVGIHGLTEVFPTLAKGHHAKVVIRIGKPFQLSLDPALSMRDQMESAGHQMMRKVQELIPPDHHGYYSADPAVRAAAKGTEIYPWENSSEV